MWLVQELEDKVKIRILGTPFNMNGELVIDFTGKSSVTIGASQPKIAPVTVTGTATDWTARTKINEIITMLQKAGITL